MVVSSVSVGTSEYLTSVRTSSKHSHMASDHQVISLVKLQKKGLWRIRCRCGFFFCASDPIAAGREHDLHLIDVENAKTRVY
jgi:hypothetical protein